MAVAAVLSYVGGAKKKGVCWRRSVVSDNEGCKCWMGSERQSQTCYL